MDFTVLNITRLPFWRFFKEGYLFESALLTNIYAKILKKVSVLFSPKLILIDTRGDITNNLNLGLV